MIGFVAAVTTARRVHAGPIACQTSAISSDAVASSADRCLSDGSYTPLADAVRDESHRIKAAFFCSGHKRGAGASERARDLIGNQAFWSDLPELPDLDNLFSPEGVIKLAEDAAATQFGARRTFFLVNGSTSGVIASIVAAARSKKSKILLPRNVHQSAIHGLVISGAEAVFLPPFYSEAEDVLHGIPVDVVKESLERHSGDVGAVVVVSPTYHGVTSDIAELAKAAHAHGAMLIVDEAHGAHGICHPNLPTPALRQGADVAIQSTHKTLGSLTQSAMLHLGDGCPLVEEHVHAALQLVQSTSPSYLLLSSLDAARDQASRDGNRIYDRVLKLADFARRKISCIEGLDVLEKPSCMPEMDPTRITVLTSQLGCSGYDVDDELIETYGVYAELPALSHITFVLSVGSREIDVQLLVSSLEAIAKARMEDKAGLGNEQNGASLRQPELALDEQVVRPRDAFFSAREQIPLTESVGRVSAATVCPYPPGIPVLMPGEVITSSKSAYLAAVLAAGAKVTGLENGHVTCVQ